MNQCLELLHEGQECPNDEILVQQVRMRLLVEKASLSMWYDEFMNNAEQKASPLLCIQAFNSQLQDLKNKIPPPLENNSRLSSIYPLLRTISDNFE